MLPKSSQWFLFMLACCLGSSPTGAVHQEAHDSGWTFYLDNDALSLLDVDQDYTGGFAFTQSGRRVLDYSLVTFGVLDAVNSTLGLPNESTGAVASHSFEFGATLFTPRDISTSDPIPGDHPYASLWFISSAKQFLLVEQNVTYQTQLTLGLLGTNLSGEIQKALHRAIGNQTPEGWKNQISNSGEPTFLYSVTRRHALQSSLVQGGNRIDFNSSLEANFGYVTDVGLGVGWRYGRIQTPWWNFNVHQSEYINLGAPTLHGNQSGPRDEFFLWSGARVRYRFYNAILQGQFRDSPVTYRADELHRGIVEAWIGVSKQMFDTYRLSFVVRGRTREIKGVDRVNPIWGGVIVSREL